MSSDSVWCAIAGPGSLTSYSETSDIQTLHFLKHKYNSVKALQKAIAPRARQPAPPSEEIDIWMVIIIT